MVAGNRYLPCDRVGEVSVFDEGDGWTAKVRVWGG